MALSHMTALAIIIPVYARGFRTLLPESADLFGPRPFGSFPYRIGCSPSMYRLGLAVVLSLDVIDQARSRACLLTEAAASQRHVCSRKHVF